MCPLVEVQDRSPWALVHMDGMGCEFLGVRRGVGRVKRVSEKLWLSEGDGLVRVVGEL